MKKYFILTILLFSFYLSKIVLILDVMNVTAAAKITALLGSDYLLLSKRTGKWMIEEVIWEGK